MTILVTGGAGFIGANFVLRWCDATDETVVNLDKLTYSGNLGSLHALSGNERHLFVRGDVADAELVAGLLAEHRPRAILHFAAETHVDRSIHGPADFVQTNVVGTFTLLDAALEYWRSGNCPDDFRFLNVSTDEVYGSLDEDEPPADEAHRYAPNSPYSASKAAADHLVRSYFHTYGLPTISTQCSNNYGPLQFPEKLIPLMTVYASRGDALPVYGDGKNVRDWLYVDDHCDALCRVLADGVPGEVYNIAGNCEMTNLEVVAAICAELDEWLPALDSGPRSGLVEFVEDRPGHDRRYALSTAKIGEQLGWQPGESFASGIRKTVKWYLDNQAWLDDVTSGQYRQWLDLNYSNRASNV
ncbi:MAG: dTDP-glucose 4,6-dehydratase [Woeseiaceae bacterium]|nr:dTDP-glucose 4,6-dehydratase [Woeseiaceae bacterium]